MIPYAICSCRLWLPETSGKVTGELSGLEIRILDLSVEGFTFRLSKRHRDGMKALCGEDRDTAARCRMFFYQQKTRTYQELELTGQYEILPEREEEFWDEYRLRTELPEFAVLAARLSKEYMRYISLKLECEDGELSESMTGYPAELEDVFSKSFSEQKQCWFKESRDAYQAQIDEAEVRLAPGREDRNAGNMRVEAFLLAEDVQLALQLDCRELWETFLQMNVEEFRDWYWKRQGLEWHPLAKRKPELIYIGNAFCPLLFPGMEKLGQLLKKTKSEGVTPVFVFSTMAERDVQMVRSRLEYLAEYCEMLRLQNSNTENVSDQRLEVVINDWGMLKMLQEPKFSSLLPTMGVLLQKKRKDPRMKYKNAADGNLEKISRQAIHADFYREYLEKTFRIMRYSYETCGQEQQIVHGRAGADLYLPFYQTNTAGHCTLHAAVQYGDRGCQHPLRNLIGKDAGAEINIVSNIELNIASNIASNMDSKTDSVNESVWPCPHDCEKFGFLYPDFLQMTGHYNSLFGYDEKALADPEYLKEFVRQGIDRLVVGLL